VFLVVLALMVRHLMVQVRKRYVVQRIAQTGDLGSPDAQIVGDRVLDCLMGTDRLVGCARRQDELPVGDAVPFDARAVHAPHVADASFEREKNVTKKWSDVKEAERSKEKEDIQAAANLEQKRAIEATNKLILDQE